MLGPYVVRTWSRNTPGTGVNETKNVLHRLERRVTLVDSNDLYGFLVQRNQKRTPPIGKARHTPPDRAQLRHSLRRQRLRSLFEFYPDEWL